MKGWFHTMKGWIACGEGVNCIRGRGELHTTKGWIACDEGVDCMR